MCIKIFTITFVKVSMSTIPPIIIAFFGITRYILVTFYHFFQPFFPNKFLNQLLPGFRLLRRCFFIHLRQLHLVRVGWFIRHVHDKIELMVGFFGRLMVFLYGWKHTTARLAIGLVCVAEEYIVHH